MAELHQIFKAIACGMAPSSSGGLVICYVHLILRMTSCFCTMGQ